MNRKYYRVGNEFTDTDLKKTAINSIIEKMEWFDIDLSKGIVPELPFSQGFALQELVKRRGYNVDKIGYAMHNGVCLLAFRNNYTKGEIKRVTVYVHDNGNEKLTPLCADEETEI